MSTILFDPKSRSLYADSRAVQGDAVFDDNQTKLFVINIEELGGECLFAGAGAEEVLEHTKSWLEGLRPAKPEFIKDDDLHMMALILTKNGSIYAINSPYFEYYLCPNQDAIQAIGTGAKFALAAMQIEDNAAKAMVVAKRMDVYSGGATKRGVFGNENWHITELIPDDDIMHT